MLRCCLSVSLSVRLFSTSLFLCFQATSPMRSPRKYSPPRCPAPPCNHLPSTTSPIATLTASPPAGDRRGTAGQVWEEERSALPGFFHGQVFPF